MSWAALANNQCISLNNLQNAVNTGVFTLKNTIPAGNEQITKADAFFYVNIDATYPPYANKASNQLVVKSDLVAGSGGSFAYYIGTQQTSGFNACQTPTTNAVIYANSNDPNNVFFYTNPSLTIPFIPSGGAGGYFSIDTRPSPASPFYIFIDNSGFGYGYSFC